MDASGPVVVLGGSGFVGRHLVPALQHAGHAVVVPTRGGAAALAGARMVTGDVFDPAFLVQVLRGASAVVNLVGILNEDGDDGRGFERVFVGLVDTLLPAMAHAGVSRLLQMSAVAAGQGASHYLQARGRAEARVRANGTAWTLLRPSVIAGPGDGLFNRFDALLALTPVLPVGRADARFQPVWVGDVAQAFVQALAREDAVRATYDLVGPRVLTLRGIIQATAGARGRRRGVIALPHALGRLQAGIGEVLPGKPISRDNWRSLQLDSVSDDDGLARLGIVRTDPLQRLPEILGIDEGRG